MKYGITQNLTADLTWNTDFAQVEVDEQQVNLTRFSLFFPEKREFFLEGHGIFDFARGGVAGGFGGALRRGGQGGGFFGGGNAPTLFYSRQIGLQNRTVVPIVGGGRVTGKIGAFDVGVLNIQADDDELARAEMTNFTVVRLKRPTPAPRPVLGAPQPRLRGQGEPAVPVLARHRSRLSGETARSPRGSALAARPRGRTRRPPSSPAVMLHRTESTS